MRFKSKFQMPHYPQEQTKGGCSLLHLHASFLCQMLPCSPALICCQIWDLEMHSPGGPICLEAGTSHEMLLKQSGEVQFSMVGEALHPQYSVYPTSQSAAATKLDNWCFGQTHKLKGRPSQQSLEPAHARNAAQPIAVCLVPALLEISLRQLGPRRAF